MGKHMVHGARVSCTYKHCAMAETCSRAATKRHSVCTSLLPSLTTLHLVLVCSIIGFADGASYTRIYTAITSWWAARARLPEAIIGRLPSVVAATLALYGALRKQLLPTPAKSHYVYNMRDLSKVFQVGAAMAFC